MIAAVKTVAGTTNFQCAVKAFHAAESDADDVNGAVIKIVLVIKYLVSIWRFPLNCKTSYLLSIIHKIFFKLFIIFKHFDGITVSP